MSKKQASCSTYKGTTEKWTRKGKSVVDADGKELIQAKSLRRAKRYMRTGKESR